MGTELSFTLALWLPPGADVASVYPWHERSSALCKLTLALGGRTHIPRKNYKTKPTGKIGNPHKATITVARLPEGGHIVTSSSWTKMNPVTQDI